MLCETVEVRVTDEAGNIVEAIVPAYTRSFIDMRGRLKGLITEYLDRSRDENEAMSLGDFAMFAITEAAKEPRTIPA